MSTTGYAYALRLNGTAQNYDVCRIIANMQYISITLISHSFADRLIVNFDRNKMIATSEKIIQLGE
ncbi:hypothetical protein [Nostoc sp. DedQUE07]|uniref:hypothetical protein n=1 Tax=Nostoc sp. DedQUE07 TaxID=3075392 RepID=UPI002AD3B61D|nr:hypothetical protein [Nostoc sp. DedQUE07]MDZ8130685.1 hypothetical protein [Nostoc sp. DedQUE07]